MQSRKMRGGAGVREVVGEGGGGEEGVRIRKRSHSHYVAAEVYEKTPG